MNRFRIRNRELFPFSSRRDLLRVDYIKVHTPRPISVYVDLSLADLAVVIAITHLGGTWSSDPWDLCRWRCLIPGSPISPIRQVVQLLQLVLVQLLLLGSTIAD